MKLYIFFRMKSEYTSNAINMKKIFRKVSILVIHLLSQMKVYIFFRLQSETINITIIMPNWHWKCFIYGLPLFSQMKLKIYFRTKNQTTSIAINWFYKFFFFSALDRKGSHRYVWPRKCLFFTIRKWFYNATRSNRKNLKIILTSAFSRSWFTSTKGN